MEPGEVDILACCFLARAAFTVCSRTRSLLVWSGLKNPRLGEDGCNVARERDAVEALWAEAQDDGCFLVPRTKQDKTLLSNSWEDERVCEVKERRRESGEREFKDEKNFQGLRQLQPGW